jgi:hypothetical protein
MKSDWKWIVGFGFSLAVTIGGWIYTYATLSNDVDKIKSEMDKANILVMQNELKHISSQNEKLENKLDAIIANLLKE